MKLLFFILVTLLWAVPAWAASCCGGGSGGGVIIPKFMPYALNIGLAQEDYQGFWNGQSKVIPDPPDSSLSQNNRRLPRRHLQVACYLIVVLVAFRF